MSSSACHSLGEGALLVCWPRSARHLLSAELLDTSFDALFIVPTYTPDTTILGARPNFSLAFAPSYNSTTATVALGPFSASRIAGDIPVGSYDPKRLSNIGIGHGAIDDGGAYTYLNEKTGTEASATLGVTENFKNTSTNYTNGRDSHRDLGAAQFLSDYPA